MVRKENDKQHQQHQQNSRAELLPSREVRRTMASSRVLRSIAPPVFERGRRGGGIGGSSLLLLLSLGGAGAARLAGATPSRVNVPSEGRGVVRGGVHLESRYVRIGDGGVGRGGEGWAQHIQVQRSAAGARCVVWFALCGCRAGLRTQGSGVVRGTAGLPIYPLTGAVGPSRISGHRIPALHGRSRNDIVSEVKHANIIPARSWGAPHASRTPSVYNMLGLDELVHPIVPGRRKSATARRAEETTT